MSRMYRHEESIKTVSLMPLKVDLEHKEELQLLVDQINQQHDEHYAEVSKRIPNCESLNKNSEALKKDSVQMRLQKQKALNEISQQSQKFDRNYQKEIREKTQLRE